VSRYTSSSDTVREIEFGKPSFRLISRMSSSVRRQVIEGTSGTVSATHSQLASRGLQTYVSARWAAARSARTAAGAAGDYGCGTLHNPSDNITMKYAITAAAIAIAFTLCSLGAVAATIEAEGNTIEINGQIELGDFDKFVAKLIAHPETKTISLSSGGGVVNDAIQIGRLIRQKKYATFVPSGKRCGSACIFIWAAGIPRQLDPSGRLYIHCVYDRKTLECLEGINGRLMNYLKFMGMPQEVINLLATTYPRDWVWIRSDIKGLVTTDLQCLKPDGTPESCERRRQLAETTETTSSRGGWQCGNVKVTWSTDWTATPGIIMEYLVTGITKPDNHFKLTKDALYLDGNLCTPLKPDDALPQPPQK
jgi:hypothetical protein